MRGPLYFWPVGWRWCVCQRRHLANRKEVEAILDSVVAVLRALKQKLAERRAWIDTMEAEPRKFMGEHQPGLLYTKNARVLLFAGMGQPCDVTGWRRHALMGVANGIGGRAFQGEGNSSETDLFPLVS